MNIKASINSKLLKQTFVYTVINFFEKAIPFLIIPILTRVISLEGIGYYTLYQTLINILIPFLTLSIDSAILVKYYKLNLETFSNYFSTGVLLALIIYLFGVIIGFVFSDSLSKLFGLPTEWVQITMVIVLLQFFSNLRTNLWRVKKEVLKFGYYLIPLTLAKNIIGLIFVFYTDLGWKGVILGHLLAQSAFSGYAIFLFLKEGYLNTKFSKFYVLDLIRFGGPISIHRIGAWLSNALNRIFLNMILGVYATGSYGVAATFGIIITVIGDAVTKAYVPFLYERLKDFNDKTAFMLVKLIYAYYGFYFLISALLSFIGYYGVALIFGEQYADTKYFVIPIVVSSLINALYKIHVDFISFTSKTYIIASITILSGLMNVFVAYWLILNFGILGAAWSTVVIQFFTYFCVLYYSNKQFDLPWLYFVSTKK